MKRIIYLAVLLLTHKTVFGMHIAEGFLPVKWAVIWSLLFIPFLVLGYGRVKKLINSRQKIKLLYAVVGAFIFVLSSLKLPSMAGSSSHLTGVALGAILFGASSMTVIGLVALLFQALLLAHGGVTTLGANAFSMVVVGALIAFWTFQFARKLKLPQILCVFLAAFFSDLAIYSCTSFQLAIAFQTETSTLMESLAKFMSVFVVTQFPLALVEGLLTIFLFRIILKYNRNEISLLNPAIQ